MNCRCPIWAELSEEGERQRWSLKTRNMQRAIRKLAEWESHGRVTADKPRSLQQAIEDFLASKRPEIELVTYRKYVRRLGLFSEYCKSQRALDLPSITPVLLNGYKAERCDVLSTLTWSKELDAMRTFFSFCVESEWITANPASRVKGPKNVKPKPIEPYTQSEIIKILAACDNLSTQAARLRARAMILLMRTIGLSVMDVKTLERSAVHGGALYVHRNKTGKPVRLDLPPEVIEALDRVPPPDDETAADYRYFFWNGRGSRENAANAAGMFLAKVFKESGVRGARSHRFRHTLTTEILENGGTAEDAANILGNSPAMIRKHYSLWSIKRQERISSLLQTVHSGTFLAQSSQQSVSL
jgi:integrase/recombinase XerD